MGRGKRRGGRRGGAAVVGRRERLLALYAEHGVALSPWLVFAPRDPGPAFGSANVAGRTVTLGPFPAEEGWSDEQILEGGYSRPDVFWMGLHELGHVALGHVYPCPDSQRLAYELEAWRWALEQEPLDDAGRETLTGSLASYGLSNHLPALLAEASAT